MNIPDWRGIESLPRCTYCDKPIIDCFLFDIDGECFCEKCLNNNFKKDVRDYIE